MMSGSRQTEVTQESQQIAGFFDFKFSQFFSSEKYPYLCIKINFKNTQLYVYQIFRQHLQFEKL